MSNVNQVTALYKQLKTEWNTSNPNLSKCGKLLSDLKVSSCIQMRYSLNHYEFYEATVHHVILFHFFTIFLQFFFYTVVVRHIDQNNQVMKIPKVTTEPGGNTGFGGVCHRVAKKFQVEYYY